MSRTNLAEAHDDPDDTAPPLDVRGLSLDAWWSSLAPSYRDHLRGRPSIERHAAWFAATWL
jgi:hypothetical protein